MIFSMQIGLSCCFHHFVYPTKTTMVDQAGQAQTQSASQGLDWAKRCSYRRPKQKVPYSVEWFHVQHMEGFHVPMYPILKSGFKCWPVRGLHVIAR